MNNSGYAYYVLAAWSLTVCCVNYEQKQDEEMLVQLLEAAMRCNGYYFSYTYNLTQSLQREAQQSVEAQKPLWEQVRTTGYAIQGSTNCNVHH